MHELLGAGSAGPGKSLVLLMDPMEQIAVEHQRCLNKSHPYHLEWGASVGWAIHFRRTMPMLEHTMARAQRFFPRIDPEATFDKQKHTWTFKSGMKFQFAHCAESNDYEGYQSSEYTHIAFDELVQFEEDQYENITSRLRSSDPVLRQMLKVRAASNPFFKREAKVNISVKDPHWVRKRFVDPWPQGGRILRKKLKMRDGTVTYRTRLYLPATLYDNPDPVFVADYEATLLDKPAHIRQAMLYGDWYVTPGSHYGDDWERSLHTCQPFKIPGDWRIFRSMDWGYKSFGCIGWYAIDYDGNLFKFHEYSFRLKKAAEVAQRVKEIERSYGLWTPNGSGIIGPADTQLWEERGDTGISKAQEFANAGVSWVRANKKSRARNSQLFLDRLKDRRAMTPGIVFFETCRDTIRTIPGIQSDPNDPESPQEGGDDHWHDETLYACSYASNEHVGTSRVAVMDKRYRDDDEEERDFTIDTRGKLGYGSRVE